MSKSNNPLQQYFRRPAVYISLPSQGEFWEPNSLELSDNKELPVFPMTAIDEITYRTPDALFNGQAVVDVIQSCVPAIRDAWAAPMTDINSILVAIRIASFGDQLEVTTICPKCNNEDDVSVDLHQILAQLQMPDYGKTLRNGDIEVAFRPMNYRTQNSINLVQFENQKIINNITSSDLPDDEKITKMTEAIRKITELTIDAMVKVISTVRTPNALVSDPDHINEFLHKCDRNIFTGIRDKAVELREGTEFRPLKWRCTACENEFQQNVSLDMTNFFGRAS